MTEGMKASGVYLVALTFFELNHLLFVLVVDVFAQIVLSFELLCTEDAAERCLAPAQMHVAQPVYSQYRSLPHSTPFSTHLMNKVIHKQMHATITCEQHMVRQTM
jgi:hypothetical protein